MNGSHRERGYCTGRETLSPVRAAGDSFRRAFTAPCRLAWLCPESHRVLSTSAGRWSSPASRKGLGLVRSPRSTVAGFSPALPTQAGVSRAFTGVLSCSRTPLARGPVVGLAPPPPRRRRTGPVRFSFGTWAFTPSQVCRRRPPSRAISTVADPARDVRVRPRPQWGHQPNDRVVINLSLSGGCYRGVVGKTGCHGSPPNLLPMPESFLRRWQSHKTG